jgi:hypothetical protein
MTLTLEDQLAASILVIRAKKTAGMLTEQEAEDLERALARSKGQGLPSAPPQAQVAPAPDSPAPETMTRPRRRRSVRPIAEPVNSSALVPEPLPPKMAAKLKEPLPPGAVENHSRIAGLSSIKPMFVIERLNDIFGIGQWKERYEVVKVVDTTKVARGVKYAAVMIVVKGYLTVSRYGIEIEQFGGNDNDDLGDAYKGACTDALTKCASHLGIGMEVYKGLRPESTPPPKREQYTPAQLAAAERKIGELTTPKPTASVKPWQTYGQMKACFATIREQLGEVEYLGILNHFGKAHAAEFKSTNEAEACYAELVAQAGKVA